MWFFTNPSNKGTEAINKLFIHFWSCFFSSVVYSSRTVSHLFGIRSFPGRPVRTSSSFPFLHARTRVCCQKFVHTMHTHWDCLYSRLHSDHSGSNSLITRIIYCQLINTRQTAHLRLTNFLILLFLLSLRICVFLHSRSGLFLHLTAWKLVFVLLCAALSLVTTQSIPRVKWITQTTKDGTKIWARRGICVDRIR